MPLSFYATIMLFALASYSMNGEDPMLESDEPYRELGSLQDNQAQLVEVDLSLDNIKKASEQLSMQVEAYYNYLNKIFGCALCHTANAIFNAKAYDHTEARKSQLRVFRSMLVRANKDRISQFIYLLNFLTFKGTMGCSFKTSCLNALKLYCPNLIEHEHEEESCVICLERAREAYVKPCNHLVYCKSCVEKNQKLKTNCSICRSRVAKIEIIEKKVLHFCLKCLDQPANMAAEECGHVATCEVCRPPHEKSHCPVCLQGKQTFIKLFHS